MKKKAMNRKAILALALAAGGLHAHAGERLLVQVPAVLDASAPINAAVRGECNVQTLVGNAVFSEVKQRVPSAEPAAAPRDTGGAKALRLTLVSVRGVGGGAYSGPKSMNLKVELTQNGKVLQSTVLHRDSFGGVFGGMKGTCAIFERVAVALGKDVAAWLPAPAVAAGGGRSAPSQAAAPAPVPAVVTPASVVHDPAQREMP